MIEPENLAEDPGWNVRRSGPELQVNNLLTLSSLGPELTRPIEQGEVSATLVVEEVRKKGPERAAKDLSGAIQRAKDEGKTRATRKHIPREEDPPTVNWEVWGPKLLTSLKIIIDTPIAKVGLPIAQARELIEKMEEK